VSAVLEAIRQAREAGDFGPLIAAVPYARFMGFEMQIVDGRVLGGMRFAEHLIGNVAVPALHGGTLGALLESTAIFTVLWEAESVTVPKTVNITVEYLRTGRPIDTFASAVMTRQGRRVANVRATAWQDDPERPIAAANAHFLI
jgi:acyl-coenzyme A thioesterase PaaI-like protein